jgi:hypothetical protein
VAGSWTIRWAAQTTSSKVTMSELRHQTSGLGSKDGSRHRQYRAS